MKNISIFCGAHEGKNPRYAEDAKKIAEILASKGINIVFGGWQCWPNENSFRYSS